jgi:hypothetical protein
MLVLPEETRLALSWQRLRKPFPQLVSLRNQEASSISIRYVIALTDLISYYLISSQQLKPMPLKN